jgi:hypothetical protein
LVGDGLLAASYRTEQKRTLFLTSFSRHVEDLLLAGNAAPVGCPLGHCFPSEKKGSGYFAGAEARLATLPPHAADPPPKKKSLLVGCSFGAVIALDAFLLGVFPLCAAPGAITARRETRDETPDRIKMRHAKQKTPPQREEKKGSTAAPTKRHQER